MRSVRHAGQLRPHRWPRLARSSFPPPGKRMALPLRTADRILLMGVVGSAGFGAARFRDWLSSLEPVRIRMSQPLTALLLRVSQGDGAASDSLLPLVYEELRAIAGRVMTQRSGSSTMQATVLVHELYIQLAERDGPHPAWNNRRHFFGVAAKAMRSVLSNYARSHRAEKRGGLSRRQVTLAGLESDTDVDFDLVDIHDALEELEAAHPRVARVVELRFLTGLTLDETAEEVGANERTVRRDWRTGQAFLRSRLASVDAP